LYHKFHPSANSVSRSNRKAYRLHYSIPSNSISFQQCYSQYKPYT